MQQHVLDTISDLEEEQKKSLRLEKDLEATADIQNRVIAGGHRIGVESDSDPIYTHLMHIIICVVYIHMS